MINKGMVSVRGKVHCLLMLVVGAAFAAAGLSAASAQSAAAAGSDHILSHQALQDVKHDMALSQQRAAALADAVMKLKKDRKTLTDALIKAAEAERAYGQDIRVSEGRLAMLLEKQSVLQKAFNRRRGEFSEVLAALQRIGLNPPPAMLVRPDDALQSVRSAALLGSVVPEIRERTDGLAHDLKNLETVTKSVMDERRRLAQAVESQQAEKKRLSLLLAEKARLQQKSEKKLVDEQEHNRRLAEKAKSLQELLAALQREEKRGKNTGAAGQLMLVQSDLTRLHGLLPLPVDGKTVQEFGPSSQGEMIETRPGAVVTSPLEGVVRYAGPFRSYGQLLIIDAGRNYHMILAGLGRIDVAQGQVLLQGEPVGVMGAQLVASTAAFDIGKSQSMLYIEIRKDGKPVNPASWWARR